MPKLQLWPVTKNVSGLPTCVLRKPRRKRSAMAKLILDFLRRIYGKNSENQFRIKASKFGFPVEDVVQIACLVYMEKKDAHDAKKGELAPFLWGHLNKTLLRTS